MKEVFFTSSKQVFQAQYQNDFALFWRKEDLRCYLSDLDGSKEMKGFMMPIITLIVKQVSFFSGHDAECSDMDCALDLKTQQECVSEVLLSLGYGPVILLAFLIVNNAHKHRVCTLFVKEQARFYSFKLT